MTTLAIVTLFFGEAFVEFTNNVAPSVLGGPNGIVGIDTSFASPASVSSNTGYYYLLVSWLQTAAWSCGCSTPRAPARAWRAVREDPLAAVNDDLVNRVKLMAFAFGAAVGGVLAGEHLAAQHQRVPDRLRYAHPDPRLRRAGPRQAAGHHKGTPAPWW